jgi:copper ion binding protein
MGSFRPFLSGLLALVLASAAGSAFAAEGQGVTVKVRVDGLACPFCAYGLEKKLKRIEGVKGLDIMLNEGLAIVYFDEDAQIDEGLLEEKVKEAGFTPRGITIEDGSEDDRDAAAGEEEASADLVIDGMRCEYCPANVSASLREVAGVKSVSMDLESKAATVIYDPAQTDPEALIRAIQAAGNFQATLKE